MNTIFVSSTFRDMNGERDVIRQKVVPLVNVTAMKYGESIWCKDLRWGIDTTDLSEKEANTKVLGVCLDEIDRSNPPFVILLGERYGWIPGRAQIRSEAERKRMELKDLEISVTALEIEYGVFSRKYTPLVYFRETSGRVPKEMKAEELAHRIKLEALKARLRKLCGDGLMLQVLALRIWIPLRISLPKISATSWSRSGRGFPACLPARKRSRSSRGISRRK